MGESSKSDVNSNPFTVYPHTLSPAACTSFTGTPLNFHRMRRPDPLPSAAAFPCLQNQFSIVFFPRKQQFEKKLENALAFESAI